MNHQFKSNREPSLVSMDLLSDIMAVTALDVPENYKMQEERAVLMPNCWGRQLNCSKPSKKYKFQNDFKKFGRGRTFQPASEDFGSFNASIKAELERFGIEEDKSTVVPRFYANGLKNGENAVRAKPVLSYSKSSSFAGSLNFPETSVLPVKMNNNIESDLEENNFSLKPKQCSFDKTCGYQWTCGKSIWDADNEECSIEETRDNKEPTFSFKDVAASLINSAPSSPKPMNLPKRDSDLNLNDDAIIEINGFSLGVTEESLCSYIDSFGTVKKIQSRVDNNEKVIKIWMKNKSECEWVISCLDGQESPIGDTNRILSVNYILPK